MIFILKSFRANMNLLIQEYKFRRKKFKASFYQGYAVFQTLHEKHMSVYLKIKAVEINVKKS